MRPHSVCVVVGTVGPDVGVAAPTVLVAGDGDVAGDRGDDVGDPRGAVAVGSVGVAGPHPAAPIITAAARAYTRVWGLAGDLAVRTRSRGPVGVTRWGLR